MCKQRFGGLFMLAMGGFLTWWNWRDAVTTGMYLENLSVLGPVVGILGLMCLVNPPDEDHSFREVGWRFWSYLTIVQKCWFVGAFAAGFLNLALISRTI